MYVRTYVHENKTARTDDKKDRNIETVINDTVSTENESRLCE